MMVKLLLEMWHLKQENYYSSVKYDNYWDDEEIYFVFDELKEFFPKEDISFTTISHCAGIIQLGKLS